MNIAKFGFNLFKGKEESSVSEEVQNAAVEEQTKPEEVRPELKWVTIYQVLYRLLSSIGYEGKVVLQGPGVAGGAVFSLDAIVMNEILQHKDPQILRHLL